MAVQTNQNFMSDLEFQKRFPNLLNQQGQQAPFGGPLGSGTPYQGLTAPATSLGAPTPAPAAFDITSPLNLGNGVYGGANTPSSLAGSIYGDAGQALGGSMYGNQAQTNQAAFGNIVQPATQTGQAAFGSITQPTTTDNLVKEVVGQNRQNLATPDDSGMSDQLIEQLQAAENAKIAQVARAEEERKRKEEQRILAEKLAVEEAKREAEAKKLAEEAALTPQQKTEKYTSVLSDQILGQNLTSKWTGGYGAQDSAKAMAKLMADAGITDIKQFGKIPTYERAETQLRFQGQPVRQDEDGNYYAMVPGGVDSEGGTYHVRQNVDKSQLTPVYGKTVSTVDGESVVSNFETIDPSQIVMKDGVASYKSGDTFGNKVTGQAIKRGSGRWENQGGDNLFSGTGAGKGNTGFRVHFTDDGTPVFYTTAGSSSDLASIAPILAIASFIPGLAPFAQGLNALIAAKQGNILGAIGGFAGLGGLTDVANAANVAGAIKSKNPLGILTAGANAAGTDLGGLANSAGLGGIADLNIGGYGITDALKAQRAVQAIQSGNPAAMISALGGYAKDAYNQDENSRGFASASDLSRSLAGRSSVPVEDRQFSLPSVDEDFVSSYGLPQSRDDLTAALPGLPEFGDDLSSMLPELPEFGGDLTASLPEMPSVDEDFPSSFAQATPRQASRSVASKGSPAAKPKYDSVGGGRGGQGGATAEEFARANAVRGNAPQTEVAKLVSSLFPSAEAGSLPVNRGPDLASQIPGQSVKAPASTYDQNNSIFGRVADELGLPQEFQRNVSNTLNALPGMNMPIGAVGRAAGAADEIGAAKYFDEAGRYIPGSNAYKAPEYASDALRMTPESQMFQNFVARNATDPVNAKVGEVFQDAMSAISSGKFAEGYKILDASPAARKLMQEFASKSGAQELGPYKQLTNSGALQSPAQYLLNKNKEYINSPLYKKTGGKAEGGLASLTKRQLAKA